MTLLQLPLLYLMMIGVPVLAFAAPLVFVVFVLRQRLSRGLQRALVSAAFGFAAALRMWQLWSFDLVRTSGPSVSYVLTTILPYTIGFAIVGWMVAALFHRDATLRRA